ERNDFLHRAEQLPHVEAITFSQHLEHLMANAEAVVAMGGYNTFCEILSFDRPALILPRSKPREEQIIRARKAQALGLLSMLELESARHCEDMVQAIQQLLQQQKPSSQPLKQLLGGLDFVTDRFGELVGTKPEKLL
ncbi:MAG: hypothetical protein MJK10_07455, partial [Pseudomonadales bacterium]|nr:hypothetical protein [Pseudomonadales bacterium]NRA15658.1 hypothetical protein [Oceanospirillaceae bacterium]